MQDGTIGRRYARALAEALSDGGSVDANVLSQVETQLSAVAKLMGDKGGELRLAMMSPSFKLEDRAAILEGIADAHGFHPITKRFLALLVEKDRVRFIESIARAFRAEADERIGRVRAEIRAAKNLEGAALSEVVGALEKKTGKKVLPEVHVDPSVISGLSARIGGVVYDGTVRSQLERLRQQLA